MKNDKQKKISVIVDDAGLLGDHISHKRFATFLIGLLLSTFMLMLGIFAAIKVLDASKRIPDVMSNKFGVVINTDADKEVCYFLLNSSQHWAETGIRVSPGDMVTIHASGTFNTAIHHVVDAAKNNKSMEDEWIDADGIDPRYAYINKPADALSLKYLEMRDENLGCLIMGIQTDSRNPDSITCREAVGRERSDIIITEEGELRFCVNEVWLSKKNLDSLQGDYKKYIKDLDPNLHDEVDALLDRFKNNIDSLYKTTSYLDTVREYYEGYKKSINDLNSSLCKHKKNIDREVFSLIKHHKKNKKTDEFLEKVGTILSTPESSKPKDALAALFEKYKDTLNKKVGSRRVLNRIFELESYKYKGRPKGKSKDKTYMSPWYDDNYGSFLVIVEIDKK